MFNIADTNSWLSLPSLAIDTDVRCNEPNVVGWATLTIVNSSLFTLNHLEPLCLEHISIFECNFGVLFHIVKDFLDYTNMLVFYRLSIQPRDKAYVFQWMIQSSPFQLAIYTYRCLVNMGSNMPLYVYCLPNDASLRFEWHRQASRFGGFLQKSLPSSAF